MTTKDVTKAGLLGLNFETSALRIGAKSIHCQGRWTELSQEDMTVLYALLTKKFGATTNSPGVSAAEESPTLELIAAFCAAGVQWSRAQDDKQGSVGGT